MCGVVDSVCKLVSKWTTTKNLTAQGQRRPTSRSLKCEQAPGSGGEAGCTEPLATDPRAHPRVM